MTQKSRDDHGLHATSAELGGDGVAHIVEAGIGMEAGPERQSFERAGERVGVNEEPVAAVAHQGDRTAQLVEGVAPSRSEGSAPFQLLSAV